MPVPSTDEILATLDGGPLTVAQILAKLRPSTDEDMNEVKRLIGVAKRWGKLIQINSSPMTFERNRAWKPGMVPNPRKPGAATPPPAPAEIPVFVSPPAAVELPPVSVKVKPEAAAARVAELEEQGRQEDADSVREKLSEIADSPGERTRFAVTDERCIVAMHGSIVIEFSRDESDAIAALVLRNFDPDPGEYGRRG